MRDPKCRRHEVLPFVRQQLEPRASALTGRLPEAPSGRRRHRHRERNFEHGGPALLANGITKVFMGIGFLLVSFGSFFFAPAGRICGSGCSSRVRDAWQRRCPNRQRKVWPSLTQGTSQTAMPPVAHTGELPPRNEVSSRA